MDTPHDDGRSRSFAAAPRRRRRFSVWTLLAPAAAVVLWVSFFSALGHSCIFKECAHSKSKNSSKSSNGSDRNNLEHLAKVKVKEGDSLGSIAVRFDLTEDELKACNPKVDPQSLQPGQYLFVSAVDCEGADKAQVGANPDPFADGTAPSATAVPDPAANGTAAADPSAKVTTTPEANTAAEQGDQG